MSIIYEQKFISGLDPTLVYLDIIQNALTFGTSDSIFQFNGNFSDKAKPFIENLISGDVGKIMSAIAQFTTALIGAVGEVLNSLISLENSAAKKEEEKQKAEKEGKSTEGAKEKGLAEQLKEKIMSNLSITVGTVISKYKIKLLGVINALTGSPSGCWHITIGNPKRPIFCSGDMYMNSTVNIKLGKTLAFNDLPSSIEIVFTLTNTRPLGAQEIFDRFNTGRGRSYVRFKNSFVEKNESVTKAQQEFYKSDLARIDAALKVAKTEEEKNKLNQEKQLIEQSSKDFNNSEVNPPEQIVQDDYLIPGIDTKDGQDYLSFRNPPSTEQATSGSPPNPPPNPPSEQEPFVSDVAPEFQVTVTAATPGQDGLQQPIANQSVTDTLNLELEASGLTPNPYQIQELQIVFGDLESGNSIETYDFDAETRSEADSTYNLFKIVREPKRSSLIQISNNSWKVLFSMK